MELASYIDHTSLKPFVTKTDIEKLCKEALDYHFRSVCVPPRYVKFAANCVQKKVPVCTVVGFPLGYSESEVKVFEAKKAIADGAFEVDMVMAIGLLKEKESKRVFQEIADVVKAVHPYGVKVIIETCYLTDDEKREAALIVKEAKATFVKTSTGFGPGGATCEDVALLRKVVGPNMGVKASGNIRTRADALAMIEAGANCIGASASVTIIGE